MSDKGIFWKMYAPLAGCLVQAEAGCESFGVSGGEEGGGTSGRHVKVGVASVRRLGGVWAASRFGMLGGMDAM